jgi:preprotein translocase SecE subunit
VANKMADKKKNASQSATRSRSRMNAAKARNREQVVAPEISSDEKEQSKSTKAVVRERDERKVQESKAVRRDNKGSSNKGPAAWQIRLRGNRYVRFVFDAYYELRHKVTWPSFNEARNMTIVVILLSGAVALVLGAADYGLQYLYILLVNLGK